MATHQQIFAPLDRVAVLASCRIDGLIKCKIESGGREFTPESGYDCVMVGPVGMVLRMGTARRPITYPGWTLVDFYNEGHAAVIRTILARVNP